MRLRMVGYFLLGPAVCQGCRRLVWWARPPVDFYGLTMLGKARWDNRDGTAHRC